MVGRQEWYEHDDDNDKVYSALLIEDKLFFFPPSLSMFPLLDLNDAKW